MKQLGYIHIYCGDGKGKTTTGMGLCARAAGSGLKVLIYQFMKDNSTCERKVLEQIPGITFENGLSREKFSFQMTEQEKKTFFEEISDNLPLYISVDKDVLRPGDAMTAWSQGDMTAEELCEKMIQSFTSMTFDGLTGEGVTWDSTGAVSKSPKGMIIENGAYVGL